MPPPSTSATASAAAVPFLLLFFLYTTAAFHPALPSLLEAPAFRNGGRCPPPSDPSATVHIAMTLDAAYLRGSAAAVHSVLRHSACPENLIFHFVVLSSSSSAAPAAVTAAVAAAFPSLSFHTHPFDPSLVRAKISSSVRKSLDQPLNFARIYLPHLLPQSLRRVIYLDSDLLVVDDISNLWSVDLSPGFVIAAPEYCHANFASYFTDFFWSDPELPAMAFGNRTKRPCYFNTGVMVMDLERWRIGGYTQKIEWWMGVQKRRARIYELGSLPPFLLVFAGEVRAVEHRWNQHGLGGDNLHGRCRGLHPGPVSLLHWSGKGKPWLRLDAGKPCPVDGLWAPYDLLRRHSPQS